MNLTKTNVEIWMERAMKLALGLTTGFLVGHLVHFVLR